MKQDANNERIDEADATPVREQARRTNAKRPNPPADAARFRSTTFALLGAGCVGLAVVSGFVGCRSLSGERSRVAPTARGEYALPSTEAVDDWEQVREASARRFGESNGAADGVSTSFKSAEPANASRAAIAASVPSRPSASPALTALNDSTAETRVARKPVAPPTSGAPRTEPIERGAAPYYDEYEDDELPPLPDPPKSFGRRVEEFFSPSKRAEVAAKKRAKAEAERARREEEEQIRLEAEAYRRIKEERARREAEELRLRQESAAQAAETPNAAPTGSQAATSGSTGSTAVSRSAATTRFGSTRKLTSDAAERNGAPNSTQTRSRGRTLSSALGFGSKKKTREFDPIASYDERRFMPSLGEIERYYSPSGASAQDAFDETAGFAVAGGANSLAPKALGAAAPVPSPRRSRQIGANPTRSTAVPTTSAANASKSSNADLDEFDETAGFAVSSSAATRNLSLPKSNRESKPELKLAETSERAPNVERADAPKTRSTPTCAPVSYFPLRKTGDARKSTETSSPVAESKPNAPDANETRIVAAQRAERETPRQTSQLAVATLDSDAVSDDSPANRPQTATPAPSFASQLGAETFDWFDRSPKPVATEAADVEETNDEETNDEETNVEETNVEEAICDESNEVEYVDDALDAAPRSESAFPAADLSFAELDPSVANDVDDARVAEIVDDEFDAAIAAQAEDAPVDESEIVPSNELETAEARVETRRDALESPSEPNPTPDATRIADETPVDANENDWLEQTQTAIRALLAERAAKLERGEDVRDDDARLRLLFLAVGERERAIQKSPDADENDPLRVFWDNECGGLATLLSTSPNEIDPTLVAERLRAGLDSLEGVCDLRIGKSALVEAPACFGLYQERAEPYRAGETALAYFELEFVDSEKTENGFKIDVECDWRLLDDSGNERVPLESRRCENYSESRLRDVVLNISAALPEDLEPGVYRLETTVRDRARPDARPAVVELPVVVQNLDAPNADEPLDDASSNAESETEPEPASAFSTADSSARRS